MYSDYNTCKAVVERGYSFIFPCKEESHRWLTETVKRSYLREYNKNAWVTDKEIREGNVRQLAECGKARRKIENEHNNVLKNCGYNLEHNFGHGKRHACEIYAILNLPGFLIHGLMLLLEEEYQKTRGSFGRRETFFDALRFSFRRFLHASFEPFPKPQKTAKHG